MRHTHVWPSDTHTTQKTHQKEVDDIICDGCNCWWCNSEPMLSEACPLQKHSSHYNKIKDNLEEARILPHCFKNVLKPGKMICGTVFSIPPFCSSAPFCILTSTAGSLETLRGGIPWGGIPLSIRHWFSIPVWMMHDCCAQIFVYKVW